MEMEKTLDQDNPKFVSSDMANAKNRKEWVRVQSFSSFPSSIGISLLLLARAGFYYTGIDAECRCFSCGKVYKKWKGGDNPYIMHRKISPNCSYMNGIESGNVPVDETDGDRPRPITNATLLTTVSDAGQEETVGVPDSARRTVVVKLGNIELEEKTESKGDKRESQDDRRQYDEDTSDDRRQYEDTSNDRRQIDEDTSNNRRQYDEDASSSTTDGTDKPNTNEAERLAGQNGDDNSSNVLGISTQRNADTSGMFDNQIDHQNSTTCTTDDCTLPNNVPTTTDSNNCLHSCALTDETSKEAEIVRFGYTCIIPKTNIKDEHHSKVYYSTIILQTQLLRYLDLPQQIRKYFETIDYKGLITTVYKNLFCIDNLNQSIYVYPVVELNDRPRANHPGDNPYLSASGNLVCHPEEDQVSNARTVRTEVQPNNARAEAHVNVSNNRVASGAGEEQTTMQPLGNRLDLLDGPRSVTDIDNLPILLENQHGTSGYQNTCTLDPGLMILCYQMKINHCILRVFTRSSHPIFNTELPSIFNLFMDRKYEDLRGKWAEIIGWSSHSFHGCDGDVMMPPVYELINFKYSFECSNVTCPLNLREICIPAMILCCPEQRFLDSCKLQKLIKDFTCEIINPCGESIDHTRPDASSFYSDGRCSGRCTIHRIVQTSPEQPPMVILNMTSSKLTRDQIGKLSGTVKIGDVHYYIGGITFSGNEHYTAIIILHQENRLLFYDNLHGIKVIDTIRRGPASDVLSLIYLFRER